MTETTQQETGSPIPSDEDITVVGEAASGSPESQRQQFGTPIEESTEAVVIIGSGAGGGTVAYELTQRGIPCVVLEAGPFLTPDDYVNDEWPAFAQMAWLDNRSTSGSWRVSKNFPNLPAWIVKAVGGSTTHWSGATP